MSMIYCHKHNRHRDSDWDVYCVECVDDVGTLEGRIFLHKETMHLDAMSDGRYYTNGKRAAALVELAALEAALEDAEAELEKC